MKKIKKNKMMKQAFKSLKKYDAKNSDDLIMAFNDMCSSLGLPVMPIVPPSGAPPDRPIDFDSLAHELESFGVDLEEE